MLQTVGGSEYVKGNKRGMCSAGVQTTHINETNHQCGMGVIELMVGLGLMTVAIMGLNGLAISAVRYNLSARLVDQATRLAQQKIEQIKHGGYVAAVPGTIVESNLNDSGNPGGPFQRTTVIANGALANTRTTTATVTWTDYGVRQTSFSTELVQ